MTIKVQATRNDDNSLHFLRIELDQDSLLSFTELINRALNTWDSAPKELKDFGDKLTHDRVTQDHTFKPINTKQNSDYYSAAEKAIIATFIETHGQALWMWHLNQGKAHLVLKGEPEFPAL